MESGILDSFRVISMPVSISHRATSRASNFSKGSVSTGCGKGVAEVEGKRVCHCVTAGRFTSAKFAIPCIEINSALIFTYLTFNAHAVIAPTIKSDNREL
ncbi:hypothetical protein FRC0475_02291 [Corynebacterium diphtheriae]|nr:hypothetical protein FRC0478_02108 [Corynebacterium diphtheriae]CAB0975478.1 hypothetical protein FRC0475_02291 [Corynebacterium diphtheriae]